MRTLSTAARAAMFVEQTEEVFLCLLQISHESLGTPIRVVANNEDVIHNGDIYTAFPFEINLPDEREGEMPRVQLTIDNVDGTILAALRSINTPPTVDLKVVLASSPDVAEAQALSMLLKDFEYDATTITGTLAFETLLGIEVPGYRFRPDTHPGLYGDEV